MAHPDDAAAEAVAHHVWMIAAYVRGMSDDPVRQAKIAANIGETIVASIEYQERMGTLKETPGRNRDPRLKMGAPDARR